MSLTLYIVRHGERLDQVDSTFAYISPEPYDPPLTTVGKEQSKKTGSYIHHLQLENVENQNNELEYIIIASPFLRTTDTAIGIVEGIAANRKISETVENSKKRSINIKMSIDPSLAEWHTSIYFPNAVPDTIIDSRIKELTQLLKNEEQKKNFEIDWNYKAVSSKLPEYPEGIHQVLERCTSSMERILEPYVKDLSSSNNNEKNKDIVLIIVTHGWCFNVIQEACAKTSNWKTADYCAVTRARWIPKSDNNNDNTVQIIITEDEDEKNQNSSVKHDKPKLNALVEYGEFDLDIISTTSHLKE